MTKLLIRILTVITLLVGCSNAGDEYVGKWVSLKSDKRIVEIERNGENFMISSVWDEKIKTQKIPAVLTDGILQVQTGVGATIINIDKTSGNLNVGGAEYKPMK